MALTIIVRNKLKNRGRSDYHKMLKDEGWGGAGLTNEEADKCEFLERQAKKAGIDRPTSFRHYQIDKRTSDDKDNKKKPGDGL
jgi:hypothetical protein